MEIKEEFENRQRKKFPKRALVDMDIVKQLLVYNVDKPKSLIKLAAEYNSKLPIDRAISYKTLERFIKDKKLASFKKPTIRHENKSKPSTTIKGKKFLWKLFEALKSHVSLVFIDESGVTTKCYQNRMWWPNDGRNYRKVHRDWLTISLVLAVDFQGVIELQLSDSNLNGTVFYNFIKKLIESLKNALKRDTLLNGNSV